MEKILINLYVPAIDKSYDLFAPKDLNIGSLVQMFSNSIQELSDGQYSISGFEMLIVEASNIGDTFLSKRAVKGRCGDFRSKAKKILPDLDCGFLLV